MTVDPLVLLAAVIVVACLPAILICLAISHAASARRWK
jgi:hypothetical protein